VTGGAAAAVPPQASSGDGFVVRLAGREPVVCPAGEPILEALLEGGIPVGYGCFTGSCGRCLARVVRGAIDHPAGCAGITERDREAGYALLCQARPLSDVEIDAAVTGELLIVPRRFSAEVVALEDVARDTRRLRLHLHQPLRHHAGQYLRLDVPGADVPRAFSIATPPRPEGVTTVELHVRRVPGGLASDGYVFGRLRPGDEVSFRAPYGRFVLHGEDGLPMLLVAGGTGLAPVEAIARAALDGGVDVPVVLYHGVRTRADLYDVELLEGLAHRHPNFEYRPVLSDEPWEGRTGLVTEAVARDYERLRGWSAYVCGPPVMVDAAVELLTRLRIPGRLIYREDFY
jgi:NAD(P)H-flavin reductase/ferredoxin